MMPECSEIAHKVECLMEFVTDAEKKMTENALRDASSTEINHRHFPEASCTLSFLLA